LASYYSFGNAGFCPDFDLSQKYYVLCVYSSSFLQNCCYRFSNHITPVVKVWVTRQAEGYLGFFFILDKVELKLSLKGLLWIQLDQLLPDSVSFKKA
jgi:hypothetical protein